MRKSFAGCLCLGALLVFWCAGCATTSRHPSAPPPASPKDQAGHTPGSAVYQTEPERGFRPRPPFLLNALVDLNDSIADNTTGLLSYRSRIHATLFRMLTPQFWFGNGREPAPPPTDPEYPVAGNEWNERHVGVDYSDPSGAPESLPEVQLSDDFASIYEADQEYVR